MDRRSDDRRDNANIHVYMYTCMPTARQGDVHGAVTRLQGHSRELEMGGAKLLGEGSGGKALVGGGQSPPEALGF